MVAGRRRQRYTPAVPIRLADLQAVRRIVTHGGGDRSAALRSVAGRSIGSPAALRAWHDLLHFVLAHPRDADEHRLASDELERIGAQVARMARSAQARGHRPRSRPAGHVHPLLNSGIEGAPIEGTWSLALVRWMVARWRGQVHVVRVEAPADVVAAVLRLLVLPVERESLDQHFASGDAVCAAILGDARGCWITRLLALLDRLPGGEPQRAEPFDRLQVVLRVDGAARGCSLTRARGLAAPIAYCPDGLQRAVDPLAVITAPLPRVRPLRDGDAAALVDAARTALATMHRETDPVTHTAGVTWHDMGRGLRIALYALSVTHRLPFDSYVGFMAFRNGVPQAYGGAWIFPGRSKVGINVFPSQRGGESAWLFAQVLRLYHGTFGVPCFEAENYQLGHGNPEGMRSGAYWFYHRLGFRPADARLRRVAAREAGRLGRSSTYRTAMPVLRELVEAGLELRVEPTAIPSIDTAMLTDAVRLHVLHRYDGDRTRAERTALRRLGHVLPDGSTDGWTAPERAALALWALPLDLVDDLERWPTADRRRLAEVVRAKGAPTETRHQWLLARHRRLLAAWSALLSRSHA